MAPEKRSVQLILWRPWLSVQNFMVIFVEIFLSELKWQRCIFCSKLSPRGALDFWPSSCDWLVSPILPCATSPPFLVYLSIYLCCKDFGDIWTALLTSHLHYNTSESPKILFFLLHELTGFFPASTKSVTYHAGSKCMLSMTPMPQVPATAFSTWSWYQQSILYKRAEDVLQHCTLN